MAFGVEAVVGFACGLAVGIFLLGPMSSVTVESGVSVGEAMIDSCIERRSTDMRYASSESSHSALKTPFIGVFWSFVYSRESYPYSFVCPRQRLSFSLVILDNGFLARLFIRDKTVLARSVE